VNNPAVDNSGLPARARRRGAGLTRVAVSAAALLVLAELFRSSWNKRAGVDALGRLGGAKVDDLWISSAFSI
jgi:hypothetical protein